MVPEGHLELIRLSVSPAREWENTDEGWGFFIVEGGFGYWRGPKGACDLAAGELVAGRGAGKGVFLASQLGALQLRYFTVNPLMLGGVLTLGEQRKLTETTAPALGLEGLYPNDTPLAREFARICAETDTAKHFQAAARLLGFFADFIKEQLPEGQDTERVLKTSQDRFELLVARFSVAELLGKEMAELAKACGCSARHFNRLFRCRFGVSMRTKQVELRLQKAQRLLRESDGKVIDVALESGYHHLGLFNSAFKKKFGVTPSKWRQKYRPDAKPQPHSGTPRSPGAKLS
jgi:AraC-like DNA-binding protein